MKRIPSLDGFRAVSILIVILSHCSLAFGFPNKLKPIVDNGRLGVTIFFVISGFLITNLLLNEDAANNQISIKNFYIRRAFRILPVFLLYTLFAIFWNNYENLDIKGINLLHALTFTMNFEDPQNWFLGHFWSLSVEEQFYLFWPFLIFFFKKNLKTIIYILIAYCCLSRIIVYKLPQFEIISLAPFFKYADSIFIGSLGGFFYFENRKKNYKKLFNNKYLQIISILLIITVIWLTKNLKGGIVLLPFGNTLISIAILFLILCYVTPSESIVYKLLNSKIVVHFGILSYSMYIWQQLFYVGDPFFCRIFPYNIAFIYLVSLCSYYLWERPFLNIRKRLTNV